MACAAAARCGGGARLASDPGTLPPRSSNAAPDAASSGEENRLAGRLSSSDSAGSSLGAGGAGAGATTAARARRRLPPAAGGSAPAAAAHGRLLAGRRRPGVRAQRLCRAAGGAAGGTRRPARGPAACAASGIVALPRAARGAELVPAVHGRGKLTWLKRQYARGPERTAGAVARAAAAQPAWRAPALAARVAQQRGGMQSRSRAHIAARRRAHGCPIAGHARPAARPRAAAAD